MDIVLHEGAQLKATAITGGTTTGGSASQGLRRSLESLGAFFHDMGVSLAVIAPYAGIAVAAVSSSRSSGPAYPSSIAAGTIDHSFSFSFTGDA